ncbi:MAG: DNA primase [Paracoccaceae bacterium]
MSLPTGFLEELRTRSSLAQVVGRKVTWDNRKSNQGKGDMWAPCPFHQEKTASFHVDDRQGFYYCFGCHAKGDAISFVRETENVGFMEAVQILAREAGMEVPASDPKAQQKADRRTQLVEVMEVAVQFYRLQLKTAAGSKARDYLTGRGLNEKAQGRWDIGFAPDNRQGLWSYLQDKNISEELIIAAGLAAKPEGGGTPYDRFRDRIIFPIRDGRGHCTGLGGRAMAANARAKYLNSPETELFDKGRSLYNHAPAREASGKGQPLVVAEGYMDTIALSEAGFGAAVAPLGTAITEDQLRLLWRISPEPVIALDGDTAGLRAAMRLIDIALPLLEAGKSLRFAMMPAGQDPDDVLRAGGKGAMQSLLDQTISMVNLLWQRETEGKVFDSPERKAALDKTLREAVLRITDKSIRGHYGQEIKDLRWQLFRPPPSGQVKGKPWNGKRAPQNIQAAAATKNSYLAMATGTDHENHLREAAILAILVRNPAIIPDFVSALEALQFSDLSHQQVQHAVLRHAGKLGEEFSALLADELQASDLEKLFSLSHVAVIPVVELPGDLEDAALCVEQEMAKLVTKRGSEREISDAAADMGDLADEGITWRLAQAAEARNKAVISQTEDKTEYETSESGARIKRDERQSFEQLLDKITYAKGPKRPH